MTEPIEKITLHVPRSPDARTEFGRVALKKQIVALTWVCGATQHLTTTEAGKRQRALERRFPL